MGFGTSRFLCCCALVAALAPAAQAAVLTVRGTSDDFEPQKRSDATGGYFASENFNNASRIGFQTNFNGSGVNNPGGITSVYAFPLPVLAPGETISNATFSVGRLPDTATGAVTPTFNADLYAVGFANAVSKTAADGQKLFYLGDTAQTALPTIVGAGDISGAVSRLVDNFLTPDDFIPSTGSATTAPDTADITAYIQSLYDDAATNGFVPGTSILLLRLNPDTDTPPTSGTQRYFTAFEGTGPDGNGGAGTVANRPTIMLTTVPEPAAAGVLMLGAFGLLRRRRA